MQLPNILMTISSKLEELGAESIIVGGAVRDHFLKLPHKDYDIEVYGLQSIEELEKLLSTYGSVNLVGKSFGILKFTYQGEEYDFSFPRYEQKVAVGHGGFNILCDGFMSYEDASRRRDFTLNAMGYNISKKTFIDPFNAHVDIEMKTLRHIDSNTFIEDPLRVYRAIQFCARFNYTLAKETFELCYQMVQQNMLEELPKERIYSEFTKLLLKAQKPSIGFELMRELGIIEKYFPELYALIDVPQSPIWHPEGDVWIHTLISIDKMVTLKTKDEKHNLKMMFAILCHDLGKATHTQISAEKISAIGHEKAGIEPTKTFMYRLTNEHDFITALFPLVEHHLAPSIYFRGNAKNSTIRRLATKVNIEELVTVARADFLGRTTEASLKGIYEAGDWLLNRAKELNVYNKPLKPLLQGRDLIKLGYQPSPTFKTMLNTVYNKQLDGKLISKTDALEFIRSLKK